MKKLHLILFIALLVLPIAVNAEFVGYSISRIESPQPAQYCADTFHTNYNCSIFTDRIFYDYSSDKDFLSALVSQGFTDALVNEVIGQDFTFYLRWKIVLPMNTSRYDHFNLYCVQTQPNNITNPTNIFLDANISLIDAPLYASFNYSRIIMQNGQQLRCDFSTYYTNGSLLQTSNPILWDLILPSYKSLFSQAQAEENLRTRSDMTDLQTRMASSAKNGADYIFSAVVNLVKMNYQIWVILFWVIMIGGILGAFSIIFYLIFWFYHYVKKKIK